MSHEPWKRGYIVFAESHLENDDVVRDAMPHAYNAVVCVDEFLSKLTTEGNKDYDNSS